MDKSFELPPNLPIPEDDGSCAHLEGTSMPSLVLHTTDEREVNFSELAKTPTVIFIYPRTGIPTERASDDWDLIPGARGCTPQSCGFRDLYNDFKQLGYNVFGLSCQTTEYQQEFVERNHIPFEIISDEDFAFTDQLELPTFEYHGMKLIKRMAMVLDQGLIEKVFYPVFPPDKNAEVVLDWIKKNK